jgi:hypothetical protein
MRKPCKYQKPRLLDLSDTTAMGFDCTSGGNQNVDCNGYGNKAGFGDGCTTGGYARGCGPGATNFGTNCVDGTAANPCCNTGRGASAGGCVAGPST